MTQPKSSMGSVTWNVTAQNEGMGRKVDGSFTQGVAVQFQTNAGTSGSVFIPNSEYTPEKVRAAIADRVSMMHAVNQLTGEVR